MLTSYPTKSSGSAPLKNVDPSSHNKKKIGPPNKREKSEEKIRCWCYYLHRSKDSVSPVCGILDQRSIWTCLQDGNANDNWVNSFKYKLIKYIFLKSISSFLFCYNQLRLSSKIYSKISEWFSLNWPTWPIQSLRCNVLQSSVCLCYWGNLDSFWTDDL